MATYFLQVIAEHYLRDGSQAFWCEFSVDGKSMTYTAISNVLRKQRKDNNVALEHAARTEYGDHFNEFFSYRKGSTRRLLVKTAQIASRYQALQAGISIDEGEEEEEYGE